MKKSSKAVLITIPSVIAAGIAALGIYAFLSKPEIYIKLHYPDAEILGIMEKYGYWGGSYLYTIYDKKNGFTFTEDFNASGKPNGNSDHAYKLEKKIRYNRSLEEVSAIYKGEYCARYDLDGVDGLYIFLKEPSYDEMCELIETMNSSKNKADFVVYALKADIYERVKAADFSSIADVPKSEPYHSYCFMIDEYLLGIDSTLLYYADGMNEFMFDRGDTFIFRSVDVMTGQMGLSHTKKYQD